MTIAQIQAAIQQTEANINKNEVDYDSIEERLIKQGTDGTRAVTLLIGLSVVKRLLKFHLRELQAMKDVTKVD